MRIALVMLFLLCGVGVSAESRQTPSKRQNATQNNEATRHYQPSNEITENNPFFVKVVPSPKSDKEAKTEESERSRKSNIELWTVGTSIVTAFILVLQLVVFGRQARRLSETVIATEKAAEAAKKQAEVATKEFVSSQRPWVVVNKIIPNSALDLKSGLSFTFIVENFGNSPGMNVNVSAVMHLPHRGDAHQVHRHLRDNQAIEREKRTAIENISFGHLLVPKEEMKIAVRIENDPTEYQKAAATHPFGEIIILILGQVCYRFGVDESWHESGFIFSVRRRGGANATLDCGVVPIEEVEIERFPAGFYST